MLSYTIFPEPHHHTYRVRLALTMPAEGGLTLVMPVWTPGSYVLREYAGRIGAVTARGDGPEVRLRQTAKAEWVLDAGSFPAGSPVEIRWEAFAYSVGIHDAFIDSDRGFINPPALFIYPKTALDGTLPIEVRFRAPGWQVHCALPETDGAWVTDTIDELLDSPYALTREDGRGAHVFTVEACGAPHEIVITGVESLDTRRISEDLRRIFETEIAFWDPRGRKAPFERYLLILHLGPGLYGGLEHAAGTMLLEDPANLPAECETEAPKNYHDFLVLVAHEYFHVWLVKRLKPSGFLPYDLSEESYTRDLWIFEGITSHFESLLARRAGVITEKECRLHMERRMNNALGREGFYEMTLAESSFCAWTKLYRPTASTPYTQISYYTKGALASLILDEELRERSGGAESLEKFLSDWFLSVRDEIAARRWKGLPDHGIGEMILRFTGIDVTELLRDLIDKEQPKSFWTLRIRKALEAAGLRAEPDDSAPAAFRLAGLRTDVKNGRVIAGYIPSCSPAYGAGIFAGDEIVAIDGERVTPDSVNRQIERARGRVVTVHRFRGAKLLTGMLDLTSPLPDDFLDQLPKKLVPIEDQKSEA